MRTQTLGLVTTAIIAAVICTSSVEARAGSVARSLGRGAGRSVERSVGRNAVRGVARSAERAVSKRVVARAARQPLGPLHTFRKPVLLERFTMHPRLDRAQGLGAESFWRRARPGRIPTAATARRQLNIRHPVTHVERVRARPGWRYHERPVRGGVRGSREAVLHAPLSGGMLRVQRKLVPGAAFPYRR